MQHCKLHYLTFIRHVLVSCHSKLPVGEIKFLFDLEDTSNTSAYRGLQMLPFLVQIQWRQQHLRIDLRFRGQPSIRPSQLGWGR